MHKVVLDPRPAHEGPLRALVVHANHANVPDRDGPVAAAVAVAGGRRERAPAFLAVEPTALERRDGLRRVRQAFAVWGD